MALDLLSKSLQKDDAFLLVSDEGIVLLFPGALLEKGNLSLSYSLFDVICWFFLIKVSCILFK